MVERVLSMHEAKGSMPFFSTFSSGPEEGTLVPGSTVPWYGASRLGTLVPSFRENSWWENVENGITTKPSQEKKWLSRSSSSMRSP